MIIEIFTEPPLDNNNYLIIDELSKEAVLTDCSKYDKAIFDVLEKYNAKLKYILLTHGHFDHITGLEETLNNLQENVTICMHEADNYQIEKASEYLSLFDMKAVNVPEINKYIKDEDLLPFGDGYIKVLHTPGHTQGGVCYLIGQYLFSGDTIFKECIGRCDLDGGDILQIVESIQNKIFTLPEETIIYPGHGEKTTVGWEKINNKFA